MKQRIITGACFVFAAFAILFFSHVEWFFRSLVLLITICSLYELQRLKETMGAKICFGLTVLLACALSFCSFPIYFWVLVFGFLAAAVCFIAVIVLLEKKRVLSLSAPMLLLCMLMVILFFHGGIELRYQPYGLLYLVFSILIPVVTDTFAYFTGRFFGKHKLMPVTSPKKTVEGAIGGILFAFLIAVVVGLIYGKVDLLALMIFVFSASIVGQFGDLSMSALKRIVGVKDYGNLFPGHGGFLDRFDSILFVWPLTYLVCCLGFDFIK